MPTLNTIDLSPAARAARLHLYRERHTIAPVESHIGGWPAWICEHDKVRVFPRQGGWYHDPSEVRSLAEDPRDG